MKVSVINLYDYSPGSLDEVINTEIARLKEDHCEIIDVSIVPPYQGSVTETYYDNKGLLRETVNVVEYEAKAMIKYKLNPLKEVLNG